MSKFVLALIATAAISTAGFAQKDDKGGGAGGGGGGGGGGTATQFQAAYLIAIGDGGSPGQLISARGETKNGVQLIGFYFYVNGKIVEREVDKIKNKIVKDTSKDESDKVSQDILDLLAKSNKAKTKLPEGRLFEIAKEKLKDTTFSDIKYENRDGTLVITFGDTTIDATTGKVLTAK